MYLVVGGVGDGRDDLVERDGDRAPRTRLDGDLFGRAVEVAGRPVPVLPFAAIHGELDDVPVGAVERLVLVQQSLDAVLAGRHEPEALEGVSQCLLIDHGFLSRRQAVNVDAEDLLGPGILGDLEPRLALLLGGEHHQQPAVERHLAQLAPEADRDARAAGRRLDLRRGQGPGGRGAPRAHPACHEQPSDRPETSAGVHGRSTFGGSLPMVESFRPRPAATLRPSRRRTGHRRIRSTILPAPSAHCQGLAVRRPLARARRPTARMPRARHRAARTGGSAG